VKGKYRKGTEKARKKGGSKGWEMVGRMQKEREGTVKERKPSPAWAPPHQNPRSTTVADPQVSV